MSDTRRLARSRIRPLVKCHGGKGLQARRIVEHFPDHRAYVEPFAGGLNPLLSKWPSPVEVAGDLDAGLMNLYRVARDRADEFMARLAPIAYDRPTFERSLRPAGPGEDEVDAAVWYLVNNRMSLGGRGEHYAWSDRLRGGRPENLNAWETTRAGILRFAERLASVELMCRDAVEVIEEFDAPERAVLLRSALPPRCPDRPRGLRPRARRRGAPAAPGDAPRVPRDGDRERLSLPALRRGARGLGSPRIPHGLPRRAGTGEVAADRGPPGVAPGRRLAVQWMDNRWPSDGPHPGARPDAACREETAPIRAEGPAGTPPDQGRLVARVGGLAGEGGRALPDRRIQADRSGGDPLPETPGLRREAPAPDLIYWMTSLRAACQGGRPAVLRVTSGTAGVEHLDDDDRVEG